jgi:hypothetical protein
LNIILLIYIYKNDYYKNKILEDNLSKEQCEWKTAKSIVHYLDKINTIETHDSELQKLNIQDLLFKENGLKEKVDSLIKGTKIDYQCSNEKNCNITKGIKK